LATVYDDPEVRRAYPMAHLLRESLATGAPDRSSPTTKSWVPRCKTSTGRPNGSTRGRHPRPRSGPSTPRSA